MAISVKLSDAIERGEPIVVLAGAGMSAESGVPTFRGDDGLWKNYRPEELATYSAFVRDPKLVWEWYNWRRSKIKGCSPNPAHNAVTLLEGKLGDKLTLVTQNVDGLHRDAGTRNYLEVHGCIWEVRCLKCGLSGELRDIPDESLPPKCTCGGLVRPGVVWFGESLPEHILSAAFRASAECAVMVVIGTSGVVYPVAHLPQVARENGAHVIDVNLERTPISDIADEVFLSPAGDVVPKLFGMMG